MILVKVRNPWHLACGQRYQLIGAFQVMVLQRRRVDERQNFVLVLAVCLCRIQMLGPFGERRIKYGLAIVRGRIRIIPQAPVAGGEQHA